MSLQPERYIAPPIKEKPLTKEVPETLRFTLIIIFKKEPSVEGFALTVTILSSNVQELKVTLEKPMNKFFDKEVA